MSESANTTSSGSNGYISQDFTKVHHFYISSVIEGAEKYTDWFHIMRQAGPTDIIYLHLNSEGGDAFTAIQMMRAMSESQAKIITSAEGLVASAATMLFLMGDQCEVSDHTMFMFHTFSSFSYGKGSEMLAQVKTEAAWGEKLVRTVYQDFFTEDEITSLIDGKDYWFDGDEVLKRLKNKRTTEDSGKTAPKKRRTAK